MPFKKLTNAIDNPQTEKTTDLKAVKCNFTDTIDDILVLAHYHFRDDIRDHLQLVVVHDWDIHFLAV